jgi:hypothetical protein
MPTGWVAWRSLPALKKESWYGQEHAACFAAQDGRDRCIGSVSDRWRPAAHQGPGGVLAAVRPALAIGTGTSAGLLDHERPADRRLRAAAGGQPLLHRAGHRPLPRQRLPPARRDRDGGPPDPRHHPGLRIPRSAARRAGPGPAAPRFAAGRRRCGLGQEHHAGLDDRPPGAQQPGPHPDHRRPDRVPVQPRPLHRGPARSRHRHAQLRRRPAQRHAPGAGHHHDRRDPRPRNHGARHRLCRDRPPVRVHAARGQCQPGAQAHHQLLPGKPAPAAAHGPVAEPAGRHFAASAARATTANVCWPPSCCCIRPMWPT